MTSDLARSSPASLLRTPQRLGILPTWWFWNDDERQRLLLPLSLVTALPLGPILFFMTINMGLSSWLPIAILLVVYPTLLMGLVERHIRRQLRRRIAAVDIDVPGAAVGELDERGEPRAADSQRAMVPRVSGGGAPRLTVRRVALACLIFSTLSLSVITKSLLLATIGGSALLVWLIIPSAVSSMLGRLAQASRPPALHEGEKRE
jgi:hypothetical protein